MLGLSRGRCPDPILGGIACERGCNSQLELREAPVVLSPTDDGQPMVRVEFHATRPVVVVLGGKMVCKVIRVLVPCRWRGAGLRNSNEFPLYGGWNPEVKRKHVLPTTQAFQGIVDMHGLSLRVFEQG